MVIKIFTFYFNDKKQFIFKLTKNNKNYGNKYITT